MVKNEIKLLKNQISKLDSENLDFVAWKRSTIILLGRIFGETSLNIKQMNDIEYIVYSTPITFTVGSATDGVSGGVCGNNTYECSEHASELLGTFIIELENFGLPDKINEKTENPQINIMQTQNQNQTVDLNLIISSIEDELTGAQLKDIKYILKSTDDEEEKKSKLIHKLGGFGADIAAKVLSNILINPHILGAVLS